MFCSTRGFLSLEGSEAVVKVDCGMCMLLRRSPLLPCESLRSLMVL